MTSRLALLLTFALAIGLGAGGLWIQWDGELEPAGMLREVEVQPSTSVSEQDRFAEDSLQALSELSLEGAPVRVRAAWEDLQPTTHVMTLGANRLSERSSSLPVRVLDRATGLPVKGVRISAQSTLKKWIGFSEVIGFDPATTDEAGEAVVTLRPSGFRFDSRNSGPLVLHCDGYARAVCEQVPLRVDRVPPLRTDRQRQTCYIERGGELNGKVTFATALPGRVQKVRLRQRLNRWPSGLDFNGDIFGDGRIGPDGGFTVKDVPPGVPFRVEILAVGEVVWTLPEFLSVRSGEVRTVDWEIAPLTVRVQGVEQDFRAPRHHRVRLEPAPSALVQEGGRAWPRANPQAAQLGLANTDGVTTFEGVLPGRWRATVVGERDVSGFPNPAPLTERPAPSFVDFSVEPRGGAVEVKLPIHRGFYIVGAIRGEGDLDVTGVTLYAEGDGGVHRQLDAPDASRPRFRIGPLVPGEYDLGLKPPPQGPYDESKPRSAATPFFPREYAAQATSTEWGSLCVDPPVRATAGGEPVRVQIRTAGESKKVTVETLPR